MGGDVLLVTRALRRQCSYALAAALVLSLGVAVSSVALSVLGSVAFQRFPYRDVDSLAVVSGPTRSSFAQITSTESAPIPELLRSPTVAAAGTCVVGDLNLEGSSVERVRALAVSDGFFDTLGVVPIAGRLFSRGDTTTSKRIAVLSERLWNTTFARRSGVIGTELALNGRNYTVTGIVSADVTFPNDPDVWIPGGADSQMAGQVSIPIVVVRRAVGQTNQSMRAALKVLRTSKGDSREWVESVQVTSLRDAMVGRDEAILVVVALSAAVVLLVASLNVAFLLMARALGRSHEFAVRLCMGARQTDIVRLIVLEAGLLSAGAAVIAIPEVIAIVSMLVHFVPEAAGSILPSSLAVSHLGASIALSAIATALCAAAPAVTVVKRRLKTLSIEPRWAARSARPLGHGIRAAFVVGQVAAAVMLLSVSSTLAKKVQQVLTVDIGISSDDAVSFQLMPPRARYKDDAAMRQLYATVESNVASIPGVDAVGITSILPGGSTAAVLAVPVVIQGGPPLERMNPAVVIGATGGYFGAAGIRLLVGRAFSNADEAGGRAIAMVSAGVATACGMPPSELIGRNINLEGAGVPPTWAEIIGVVNDVRLHGPERDVGRTIYVPLSFEPPLWSAFAVARWNRPVTSAIGDVASGSRRPIEISRYIRFELSVRSGRSY